MKHLIVCCDGTWNTPDQEDNGLPAPTNVVKLMNCLSKTASVRQPGGRAKRVEQRAYYHPGVGTEGGPIRRFFGGAFGSGLSDNIKSGYRWLARNYEQDDRIFVFGFSRGAYTVRSLGGMIGRCGLLNLNGVDTSAGWERVHAAYDQGYRKRDAQWADSSWAFHGSGSEISIHFMGVWDTVGALGIPNDLAFANIFDSPEYWQFHDTELGTNVGTARHAVALDEQRASFTPTLWVNEGSHPDIKQVWFPGVHADVGGGYSDSGLSDGALKWMIDEATGADLTFDKDQLKQLDPDPKGVLHDPIKGVFKKFRTRPRNTPPLTTRARADIHASARSRKKTPPIIQAPYRPTQVLKAGKAESVNIYARPHWNATGLYLETGRYALEATGQWLDQNIPCGPDGCADGTFQLGKAAHLVGSAVGALEGLWKKLTGNQDADIPLSRRHEAFPWFVLVGVAANCTAVPSQDGTPAPHQTFNIGSGMTLNLSAPGYLYAYANDAWSFYSNNRGSVQLTVKRIS